MSGTLYVIGTGPGSPEQITLEAQSAIAASSHFFGYKPYIERLNLAPNQVAVPSDNREELDRARAALALAAKGNTVAMVSGGDPGVFAMAAAVCEAIDTGETEWRGIELVIVPGVTAMLATAARIGAPLGNDFCAISLSDNLKPWAIIEKRVRAAAGMGWPLQDVTTLSLHGRPIELVLPHLHPGRKILALTSDETEPARISGLLTEAGFGRSAVTVLDALGGPHENVRTTLAQAFQFENINPLNVLAIDILADENARIVPLTPGLPDDWFDHDGQITKREIRALTLSALAPRRGELLWDIGAGSGSVSIEWMLSDPSLSAIAIEADPVRSARIADNAALMGVPGLTIRVGRAPQVLEKLEQPDAIFIGGGGTEDGVVDAAIAALRPGGRLVANAVTLEMEALLALLHQQMGGSLTRIQIARAEPLGTMSGWRPAMPVTQWVWVK
jgi:precorrin-6Y C5,15-methyltransferase (decarboxylating)